MNQEKEFIQNNINEFSMNFIFKTLTRQHDIYLKQKLKPYNIGVSEFYFILRLYSHRKTNQHNLAKYFILTEGTVAKIVRKLEDKELITRQIDQKDRRQNYISLTSHGIDIAEHIISLEEEWQEIICEELTSSQIDQLNQLLETITYKSIEERNNIV